MIRRPPRSTPLYSSAASDVYKRQIRVQDGRPVVTEFICEDCNECGKLCPDGQVRTALHTERFTISSAHRALGVVYLCSHRITSYPSRYSRRTQEPSPRGMAFCVSILRFLLVNSATSSTMVSRK